ncbi:uncharacterized protein LOC142553599 isoform X3 [Primulina tabacum]|uniref:uncharacterized protein LOC142553599 isoform X3 n=1 Tax=Primulina tabacum TaxID=48773 RepID=UPI003F5AA05F
MKLLELCNSMGTYDLHEEILPGMLALSSIYPWFAIPLTFEKEAIETIVLARATYYQKMLEKMDGKLAKIEFSSRMSYRVEQHKGDVLCFSILTDTRQEIFLVIHLTTLAIYCQAQDKSFCIYFAAICSITTIPSILVQVEDMSDLETVHMLYLTESLRIKYCNVQWITGLA